MFRKSAEKIKKSEKNKFILGFVVPCVIKHSNKTSNQMQQSVVKFIALSRRRCSTCFGQYYAHHQDPLQTAVVASGFRVNGG
jgi:hypothetical protein